MAAFRQTWCDLRLLYRCVPPILVRWRWIKNVCPLLNRDRGLRVCAAANFKAGVTVVHAAHPSKHGSFTRHWVQSGLAVTSSLRPWLAVFVLPEIIDVFHIAVTVSDLDAKVRKMSIYIGIGILPAVCLAAWTPTVCPGSVSGRYLGKVCCIVFILHTHIP